MGVVEVFRTCQTGVAKVSLIRGGNVISAGTAFLVDGGLITNSHVLRDATAEAFEFRFSDTGAADAIRLPSGSVLGAIAYESPGTEWDVAFLKLTEPELTGRHVFTFRSEDDVAVGQQVAFIGYPFEMTTITCHVGYISSLFERNGVTTIQLDASVNGGNSGGPLLEISEGSVVGIVTRAHIGFVAGQFDNLIATLQQNVEMLSNSQAVIQVGGIDPIQGLRASQAAMLQIASNLRRSANVGIGYAFAASHVRDALSTESGSS